MRTLGCIVLIPTYCNAGTLFQVVSSVLDYCGDVIVVDDGSTDGTQSVLDHLRTLGVRCVGYAQNRGKGYALRYGMRKALAEGFHYAITMDSDGQHLAEDLPLFLQAVETNPDALIVGQRDFCQPNMPKGNLFANRFSSFWYKLETGVQLMDTQSGFRVYPLEYFARGRWFSRGYAYELEALVRWPWRGGAVVPQPMRVYYPPVAERISHFRPWRDFTRMSFLHTLFTVVGLLFIRPWNYLKRILTHDFQECVALARTGNGRQRVHFCFAVGWGVLCGVLPIWGYQLLFALWTAHFFHLNRLVVALFSNISLPPMIPFIIYLSILCGCWLCSEPVPPLSMEISFFALGDYLRCYLLGSLLFALIAGVVAFLLSFSIFSIIPRRSA